MSRILRGGLWPLACIGLSGCLGEPPIEERWTLLEVLEATPASDAAYAGGTAVTVRARITYRELLTGFLVADLREAALLTSGDTSFDRGADDPLRMARDVDDVLLDSVTLGHDAMPVTGFDHLIQEVTLTFDSAAPAGTGDLFLGLYFSSDVEEVEQPDGSEIEIVTPTFSTERDILSAGVELTAES